MRKDITIEKLMLGGEIVSDIYKIEITKKTDRKKL